jgi:hypothetical protein
VTPDPAPAGNASVAAVVLASRGGDRLARALASVGWAAERVVLDPAARLAGEPLAAGVARHRGAAEPAAVTRAPWLLLLTEDETVSPALAQAITAAVAAPAGPGYRLRQELAGFGVRLRLPGRLLRLAHRDGARLRLGPGLTPVLRIPAARRQPSLEPPILVHGGARLADAVVDLDADATTLAAVLGSHGVAPARRHLVLAPLVAGGRVLAARRVLSAAWGRWFLAVLASYRAVAAYAKLWELRRVAGVARA